MTLQIKYFWLAKVFAGLAGIWLPMIVELIVYNKVTFHNIPQNVPTYSVSLVFAGCIDFLLSKLRIINIVGYYFDNLEQLRWSLN